MRQYLSGASLVRLARIGACLALAACTSASEADKATVLLCDPHIDVGTASFDSVFFSQEGAPTRLLVVDGKADVTGCRATTLPGVSADTVRWAGPVEQGLDDSGVHTLLLQGQFADKVSVSEVMTNQPVPLPPRTYLPFNRSTLHAFTARAFGADERAQVNALNDVICEPGEQVAGVFYGATQRWLATSPMTLVVEAEGNGHVEVAIGDSLRDQQEAPLVLGRLALEDGNPKRFRFDVPGNERLWSSLTFVCPAQGATLRISDLQMVPQVRAPDLTRGAWFWSPDHWQRTPQALWRAADARALKELYVTVPVTNGEVDNAAALSAFVDDADARGVAVWAVIGDPRDVLTESWPALQQRLTAFLSYNDTRGDKPGLAGVQLDIEPYLLAGFAQNHALWRERYVDTVAMAQAVVDRAMPIDLVVPSWWGIHPQWGEQLFDALDWSGMRMTAMNYHTDPERLRHDAEPFLSWAQNRGVEMRIALEAGTLSDETQQRYVRSGDKGTMWLTSVEHTGVLLLFDRPQSALPGTGFTFQSTATVPASRHTFAGDLDQLMTVAAALEAHWQQWSSFGGVSLHGLDEIDTADKDE